MVLAASLADHLRQGGMPAVQPVNIRLGEDEVAYGAVQGQMFSYTGADYVDPGSTLVVFGSPMWMVGTLGASMAVNAHRRKNARAAAAHQWRLENQGLFYVTNERLAVQGVYGWTDLYYDYFRATQATAMGIVAHFADWPMVRFSVDNPAWTWVMFSYFVLNQVPEVDLPPELLAKLSMAEDSPRGQLPR